MENISNEFVKELRMSLFTSEWTLDKSEFEIIVPIELTHKNLFERFGIDKSIIKYYYLPTSKLLNIEEVQELRATTGFIGEIETALLPYSEVFYGAYHKRTDLSFKLSSLIESRKPRTIEGKEVKSLQDLIPYFKDYADGFKKGFNEFEESQVKPFLSMLSDRCTWENCVFSFITKRYHLTSTPIWRGIMRGFATDRDGNITKGFEQGQEQGWYYRAWCFILSNQNLFSPLFETYFEKDAPNEGKKGGRTKDPEVQKRNLDISNDYKKYVKVDELNNADALDRVYKSYKKKFTGEPKNIKDQIRRIIKATQSDTN